MCHCLIIEECLHLHDKLYFSEASAISIIFLPFPTLDGISFDTDSFYLHVRSFASKDSLLKNFGNFWISSRYSFDFLRFILFRFRSRSSDFHPVLFALKVLLFASNALFQKLQLIHCFLSLTIFAGYVFYQSFAVCLTTIKFSKADCNKKKYRFFCFKKIIIFFCAKKSFNKF